MSEDPPAPLPLHALRGAPDAVLALDRSGMLAGAYVLREFRAGDDLDIGPFRAETRLLPHWVPNAGLRLAADGIVLAYTGDSGPDAALAGLADHADLLLAEATYADQVPEESRRYLSSARSAGRQAAEARVRRLLLTHLWPGTNPSATRAAAAGEYDGPLGVAASGLVADLTKRP